MYVCLCNAVTEDDVLEEAAAGANTLEELSRSLGVATGCGCCREHAETLLQGNGRRNTQASVASTAPVNAYAV